MIPREKGVPMVLLGPQRVGLFVLVYYVPLAVTWIVVATHTGMKGLLLLACAALLVKFNLLMAAAAFAVPYYWWLDGRPGWLGWTAVGIAVWIQGVTWLWRQRTLRRNAAPVQPPALPWQPVCDHAPQAMETITELLTLGQPERALQHCLELLGRHPVRTRCGALLRLTAAQAALDAEAPGLAVHLTRRFLNDDDRPPESDVAAASVLALAQAVSGDIDSAAAWAADFDQSLSGELLARRFAIYTIPVVQAYRGVHDEAEGFLEALAKRDHREAGALTQAASEALPFILAYGRALLATGHSEEASRCFSWVITRTNPDRFGPSLERVSSLEAVARLGAWAGASRWWALAVRGSLEAHPDVDLAEDDEARAEAVAAAHVLTLLGGTSAAQALTRRLPEGGPAPQVSASARSISPAPHPWMLGTADAATMDWGVPPPPEPGEGACVTAGLELYRALYTQDAGTGISLYRQSLAQACGLLLSHGKPAEALALADREVVVSRRSLDHRPLLAAHLHRAECLASLGRTEDEIGALRFCLVGDRQVPSRDAESLEWTATTARRLCVRLQALGRWDECVPLARQEINSRRELAASGLTPHFAAYAESLKSALPVIARGEGHQSAVDVADDLVSVSRQLLQTDRGKYLPLLLDALQLLARALEDAGATDQRDAVLDDLQKLTEGPRGHTP